MGFFTNLAMNAIMKTSHPEIDRRQCWNLRPHRDRCEACMKICPKGLFTRAGFIKDWTGCIDCGLCVSACRSRCIAPSADQVEQDVKPAELDNESIWIGCDRSARQNDVLRECVGSFAWENLAYLALNKKLVLDLTPCPDCDRPVCVEHVRGMVRRLAEFLGPELFSARITLAEEETDAPYEPQGYSRREMMSHLTQTSKLGTRQLLRMLPGMEDEQRGHALDHRLMLNQRIKQLKAGAETPLHYGFYLPTVTDACYGCGKCERACRAGALKLMENDDGFTRLVVTPWKCSECGQCVSACTDKAMPELTLRQITTLGPVSVHKLKVELCPECGKPMIPGSEEGICKVCLSRRKMKQRREEAAARAKERAEERKREQEEKAAAEAAAALAAGTAAADAAPAPAEDPAAPEQAVSAALPAQEENAEAAPKAAPAEDPAAPEQAVSAALPAQEENAEAAPKAAPAENPAAPEAQA